MARLGLEGMAKRASGRHAQGRRAFCPERPANYCDSGAAGCSSSGDALDGVVRRARGSLGARAIFSTVGVTVAIGSWTISCSCAVGRWLGLLSTASSATLRGAMRGSLGTLNPPRSKAPARLMIDSERSSASVDLGAGDSAGTSALGAVGMGADVGVSVDGAAEGFDLGGH